MQREAVVGTPAWPGTAIACTSLLPALECSVMDTPEIQILAPDKASGAGPSHALLTAHRVSGALAVPLMYNGLEGLWCTALGYSPLSLGATAQPELMATGVYRHLFALDRVLADRAYGCGEGLACGQGIACGQQLVRRQTLAQDKQVCVWEHRSTLVTGWALSLSVEGCTLALELLGTDQILDSAVNTAAGLAGLTEGPTEPVRLCDTVFRLGPFSTSSALSSSHDLPFTALQIRCTHGLDALPTKRSQTLVDVPVRRAPVQVSGSLTLPRHQSTTQLLRLVQETPCMASLVCTGVPIPGTSTPYTLEVFMPCLRLLSDPLPITGPGLVPETLEWLCFEPLDAAAGMPVSTFHSSVLVRVTSGLATHQLL